MNDFFWEEANVTFVLYTGRIIIASEDYHNYLCLLS